MNEYLAIDISVNLYEQPLRISCNMAGCVLEKLRWCVIEHVLQYM